ncbi:MAG: PIN domain-containing protein [Acidobacteria bacterium]|nr:PIN domain-containing protein [Acidobacteriota bacterium]
MICADTSVWVNALRDRDSAEGRLLDRLLDEDEIALPVPVRIELLSGVSRDQEPRLRRALSGLPVLSPTGATWERMDRWVRVAAARGHRFGVGDLLIAAIAAEHGTLLWSLDSDVARMERLGFIARYGAERQADAWSDGGDPPG